MVLENLKYLGSSTFVSQVVSISNILDSSGFRSVRVPLGFQVDAQSLRVPLGSQVAGSSVTGSRSVRISPGSQVGGVKWNRKWISENLIIISTDFFFFFLLISKSSLVDLLKNKFENSRPSISRLCHFLLSLTVELTFEIPRQK